MSGGSSDNWLARLDEQPLRRRQPIPAYAMAVALVALARGLRFVLGGLLVGVPPPSASTALKNAMSGSIFAMPEACFVITMALPRGSTLALLTAHAIRSRPP